MIQRIELVNLLKRLVPITALSFFIACSQTGQLENHYPTSEFHYRTASEHYKAWLQNKDDNAALKLAVTHFEKAYSRHPYNTPYALDYYTALGELLLSKRRFDEQQLLRVFESLPASAKQRVDSPSYLRYQCELAQHALLTQRIFSLQKAIRQNPRSAKSWGTLAEEFYLNHQFWPAHFAAERASELKPTQAKYWHLQAKSLLALAQGSCNSSRQDLVLRAQKFSHNALSVEPNNSVYLALFSETLLELGESEAALTQARLAFAHSENYLSARALAHAAIANRDRNTSTFAMDYLATNFSQLAPMEMAMLSWKQKDTALFLDYSEKADRILGKNFHLLNFGGHLGPSSLALVQQKLHSEGEQAELELLMLIQGEFNPPKHSLPCEAASQHYFWALGLNTRGEKQQSKQALEYSAQLAPASTPGLWANWVLMHSY